MPLQSFLIAPLKSGVQTNRKPWLIADDAYELLRNVYTWRGRVKKRIGARVMDQAQPQALQQQFTRLRANIGTTNGAGNLAGNTPVGVTPAIGQMFSIAGKYYIVNALGNPAALLQDGTTAVATYDTTTRAFVFVGAPAAAIVYFYPATPVMHIALYQQLPLQNERTIAFDTNLSYEYTQGLGWQRSGVATQGLWSGSNSDFHWTTNWRGVGASSYLMFVVNNVAADGIQYFDGTDWFVMPPPAINAAGDTLITALIIEVFKGFLIAFNTLENITPGPVATRFANRIRWSKQGSPLDVDSWRDDIDGLGDFINAPTREAIVSVQSLKDRLIVFFENSTYELVYTGNLVLPFDLQKINTELGVESTHSTIPFDKVVMGMGSTGVHACTGLNVERIDQDIPSTVFDIVNVNNGPLRVHGIRDYYEELAYWTYPSNSQVHKDNNVFPNRMLVMDYTAGTWAFFDDSITTFGYFFLQDNYLIWQNIFEQWQNMDMAWNAGQGYNLFRAVLAGNQEGWTFIMMPDTSTNSMSLQITDMTPLANSVTLTVINHNINKKSPYIFLSNIQSTGTLSTLNGTIQEAVYISANQIRINVPGLVGVYQTGGTIERVAQIQILTKQYQFFPDTGERCFIAYADFYVDRTSSGKILVDYVSSTSALSTVTQAQLSGALLGTNILETSPYPTKPWEQTQEQFWHRIYFQQDGETVGLSIYHSNSQMLDGSARNNGFVINAAQYYASPTSSYI